VRGFTLPELLMVMALAAVLLVLATPALTTLNGNMATAAEAQRLLSLLRVARASAAAGRVNTVLCPVASQVAPACGDAFSGGWLLFADENRDGRYRPGEDALIRIEHSPPRRALHATDRRGRNFAAAVSFRPDGSVRRPATIRLCTTHGARTHRVVISMTGRVRSAREEGTCLA
jgi:type IV fimbrial biogenesis protein FimT